MENKLMLKALHFFEKCSEQWMNYCDSPKQPLIIIIIFIIITIITTITLFTFEKHPSLDTENS